MGTIRNRMVIVQHYDKAELEEIRNDAIKTFQKAMEDNGGRPETMVSPIMTSYINEEYTFVINGECSKSGWDVSNEFQIIRQDWCNKFKDIVENILIVDFGEDFEAFLQEFN